LGFERGLSMRAGAVVAALLTGALLAGCGGESETPEPGGGSHPSGPRLVKIAALEEPISLAQAPGTDGSLYIAERGGRVRLVRASGAVERRPVLDLSHEITTEGEGGLLSLTFDPDFERNRLMYVDYAGDDKRIIIASYRLAPNGEAAVPSSRREVLAIPHPNYVHWGGQLAFGPDGSLYAGTGDGGPPYPIPDTAQDPKSLLGKLLRIDPAGGGAEVAAMGLRNPWRYSFDLKTGDVWIGDVGDFTQEEIDHVAFDELEGDNFGWPGLEGTAQTKSDVKAPADAVPPVLTYERTGKEDDPVCAVTGGYVVRDRNLPTLAGRYLYSDFCEGKILAIDPTAKRPSGEPTGLSVPRLVSFGEDLAGRIYAISLEGPIYRIAED
jgi:glucose/arabinose dehydrogenase